MNLRKRRKLQSDYHPLYSQVNVKVDCRRSFRGRRLICDWELRGDSFVSFRNHFQTKVPTVLDPAIKMKTRMVTKMPKRRRIVASPAVRRLDWQVRNQSSSVFNWKLTSRFVLGFECRCGGLYCAIHRYSDKHECSFDYREHGAAEIRRNNPVVVGEKIQKIWSVCVNNKHPPHPINTRRGSGGGIWTVNSRCV